MTATTDNKPTAVIMDVLPAILCRATVVVVWEGGGGGGGGWGGGGLCSDLYY